MITFILGRRCGTSSLAKGLHEAGLPLREPLDKRKHPSNLGGHYENLHVRALNQTLIRRFRITSRSPAMLPFAEFGMVQKWLREQEEPVIVKEPNLNFTWPIWARSSPHPISIIRCRRDPKEQEASLVKWYDVTPEEAKWTVAHYECSSQAAADYFDDVLEVELYDPDRITKAVNWYNERKED